MRKRQCTRILAGSPERRTGRPDVPLTLSLTTTPPIQEQEFRGRTYEYLVFYSSCCLAMQQHTPNPDSRATSGVSVRMDASTVSLVVGRHMMEQLITVWNFE